MNRLNFSTNWNGGKLDCDSFSTIRLNNEAVHYVGKQVEIFDQNTRKIKGVAIYMIVTPFQLHQLKESAAYLDTGYNLEATKAIIHKMYRNKPIDVDTATFCYCILKKVKIKPTQQNLFK